MASYVAVDTIYPTVGELVMFVAQRSGLVSATFEDLLYERLKLYVREQKGKDFAELELILDALQDRLERWLAPPGIGDITFQTFRRILNNYKAIFLQGTASVIGRERLLDEVLIPTFFVPNAATLLRLLSGPPFDFINIDDLLRADAPLTLAFEPALTANGKTWMDLADLYQGKFTTRGGHAAVHDIDDKKKLIRQWGKGKATPTLQTTLDLLDGLNWGQFSGVVFWVWIARFLQKIDKRHRLLIADAIQANTPIPKAIEIARRVTTENDAIARAAVGSEVVSVLRHLSALLFYEPCRNLGDKDRVEKLLAEVRALVRDAKHVHYYVTWLEARYWLYCGDSAQALHLYEQAYIEGMYGDPQAEMMVLPECAALAQKMNARTVLKRIDSRMKLLNIYPALDKDAVAALRLKAYKKHLGAHRHFIEAYV